MAGLQELRKRLRSIQTTGQLAGAMRTAATAKYAKLGKVRGDFAPYAAACREMLRTLGGAGIEASADAHAARDCVIVMGGNRGLCGGFNAELMRLLDEQLPRYRDPILLVCGRKAAAHLREKGAAFTEYPVSDVPRFDEVKAAAERARALYSDGTAACVHVVYQRFKNMLTQIPSAEKILPAESEDGPGEADGTLLYMPDRETIGSALAVSCFDAQLYEAALENALGAQAATMMAMRSACDNAEEAAAELEIMINRRRQAEVTSSVIETASGNFRQGE